MYFNMLGSPNNTKSTEHNSIYVQEDVQFILSSGLGCNRGRRLGKKKQKKKNNRK